MEPRFLLTMVNASDSAGWLTLGGPRLLPTTVEIRIEQPQQ